MHKRHSGTHWVAATAIFALVLLAPAIAQAPPCDPPKFLNANFGIENRAYTWKIDYQGNINAYYWWHNGAAGGRAAQVDFAFEQWEAEDRAHDLPNVTFTQVAHTSPADFVVNVYMGPGQIPYCDAQIGFECNEVVHPLNITNKKTSNAVTAFNQNLDWMGVRKLANHVIGHLHGLADGPATDKNVMADGLPVVNRLENVTNCDATAAGLAGKGASAGVGPINVIGCGLGGCPSGIPCSGSWDQGLGWCSPGVGVPGGGSVWTDWVLGRPYFGTSPNLPAQAQIASPSHGAVLPNGWSGVIYLNAFDPDGRIIRADYYVNDQFFASSGQWPYSLSVSGAPPGSYKIQVSVLSNGLTSVWSNPIWITVQSGGGGGGGGGGTGILSPWQRLYGGQRLYSSNGLYYVTHQGSDGNFVLYVAANDYPIWSSQEFSPNGGGYTEMDGASGNLVSYRTWTGDPFSPFPYWAANPQVQSGNFLRVNDDSSLLIYAANGTPICMLYPTDICP